MKKVSSKKLVGVLSLLLVVIIGLVGCGTSDYSSGQGTVSSQETSSKETVLPDQDGNPYSTHKIVDGETIVEYDYSEAYEKLDLSEYTKHGKFGEDGIMWVEKSNYSGIQYGYINYNGEFIVPLTSDIVELGEFKNGFATVVYEYNQVHCNCGLINAKGDVISKYTLYSRHNYEEHMEYVDKKIMIFENISIIELSSSYEDYLYFTDSDKFINITDMHYYKEYFSFAEDWIKILGKREGTYPYVKFYNKNGDLQFEIDENSNENYKMIWYVDDFKNEKSTVKFIGQDNNCYSVLIDKNGNWLEEPQKTEKDTGKSFFN